MRAWLLVFIAVCGNAAAQPPASISPPSGLTFKSHYLVDFATDRVLAASAADTRVEPASLTKLMTAYIVFSALKAGRIRLDEQANVSERAWRMDGTRMFIELNSHV